MLYLECQGLDSRCIHGKPKLREPLRDDLESIVDRKPLSMPDAVFLSRRRKKERREEDEITLRLHILLRFSMVAVRFHSHF